jgi:nicotinamidase-related amidase
VLRTDDALLVIVDVQEKLAAVMHERERLIDALQRLVRGARALGVPVLWLEQNPLRLGATVPAVAAALEGLAPIAKMCFCGCDCGEFMSRLEASGRRQVLLAGIEAHICVYQTAAALAGRGYEVQVVCDAVSSRTAANRDLALARVRDLGIAVTGVEMALYELVRVAEGERFKEILRIIK